MTEYSISRLGAYYPPEEAEELAYWVIEERTGMNRFAVRQRHDVPPIADLEEILEQLCRYVPVQYIFGHTEWLGLDLLLNSSTLIPRPETAEMVEKIRSQKSEVSVLDIGTGSGCIALALKRKHPEWQVTGVDISAEAIAVAQANALRNKLDVSFRQADIFGAGISADDTRYDLIVSNPPYIRPSERGTMTANTLLYEPEQALFVPEDDPLLFYRRIADLRMAPELWLEISETQGDAMLVLMQQTGYEAECLNDMYGHPRFIHAIATD